MIRKFTGDFIPRLQFSDVMLYNKRHAGICCRVKLALCSSESCEYSLFCDNNVERSVSGPLRPARKWVITYMDICSDAISSVLKAAAGSGRDVVIWPGFSERLTRNLSSLPLPPLSAKSVCFNCARRAQQRANRMVYRRPQHQTPGHLVKSLL